MDEPLRREAGALDVAARVTQSLSANAREAGLGATTRARRLEPSVVPRIAYLNEQVPITKELLVQIGPAQPSQVFRIAAHCEEQRCAHFNGQRCKLATRIVEVLPAVVDALPHCLIRSSCRWYSQEGKEACFRCPQVVTEPLDPTPEYQRAVVPRD